MPKLAANLTMMFNEVEFLDRFDAAAKSGFEAVEFALPYDYERDALAERLADNNLVVALHNLPAGDWAAGERGIATDPARMGEFQDGVGLAVEYAKALRCGKINCLAGIPHEGADADELRETFVSNLRFAASKLGEAGIRLLVEPINTRDIPGFYLNYSEQALSIIEEVGSDNLWLQYDVYHMQIMEGDLIPTMRANLGSIGHIQIADTPGRHEPGTGEINYPNVFSAIDEMGYDGWIGCEYIPLATTEAGLGWADEYLRRQSRAGQA